MIVLIGVLILVAVIGYLAQTTGLCMVRGMNELLERKPEFLIAILLSGVWAWVAPLGSYWIGSGLPFRVYEAKIWFGVGGFLFGIGTASNQGCGISTLSRLSRGELQMVATVVGWIVGWSILAYWNPDTMIVEMSPPAVGVYGILILLSVSLSVWALLGGPKRRKLWFSMMGIGLLAGFLFLFERGWTPSGLLHDVSTALLTAGHPDWPTLPRYGMFVALIVGMALAAWWTKRFDLKIAKWPVWSLHLMSGILMGVGASLAMGGNDSQLLTTLPAFSPAGFLAVACMLMGILFGLVIRRRAMQLMGVNR
jgi:hypothetical protein